jgi:hypothetical protein
MTIFVHHGTPWTLKNYLITVDTIIDFKNGQIILDNIFGQKRRIVFDNKSSLDFSVKKIFLFDTVYYYVVLSDRSSRIHVNVFDMSCSKEEAYSLVDSVKLQRDIYPGRLEASIVD